MAIGSKQCLTSEYSERMIGYYGHGDIVSPRIVGVPVGKAFWLSHERGSFESMESK